MQVGSRIRINKYGRRYTYTRPGSEGIVTELGLHGYYKIKFYKITESIENALGTFDIRIEDCEEISTNIFEGKCNKI